MGLTLKSNNKTINILLSPLRGLLSIVRWFSIGFFKSSSFMIEYIIDLIILCFKGLYVTIKNMIIYGTKLIKYDALGILATFMAIGKFLYFDLMGIKFVFYDTFVMLGKRIKKEIQILQDKSAIANEGKPAKSLSEFFNNLSIVKSLNNSKEAEKGILFIDPESAEAKRSDELQVFRYLAKNKNGKFVRGSFFGYSKLDVNSYLINEGFQVYQIETSKWINFYYGKVEGMGAKLRNKDLVFWLKQLATYIKSGIPLTQAVRILGNQMGKSGAKKRLFDSIVYELSMGESFSKALEKQTGAYPDLLINMIKAAEATGELEETLFDMAEYYNEIEKTRKQMISAMTYPSLILTFAVGVLVFIMLYVVPKFQGIYTQSGMEVKGATLALINLSTYLKSNIGYIAILVIAIIVVMVIMYKNIKAFRIIMQTFAMKMPVFGNIIIYNEMTIFTKTFSSLLKNNVYITESIDILSKITKNEIYRDIMFNTITNIAKGDKISDAFKDHWAIPEVAYFMIVTGESTGELANMMTTVSEYYQELHRGSVNALKALIEPILIVLLAGIVGVVVLAVVVPMFDMYSSIDM